MLSLEDIGLSPDILHLGTDKPEVTKRPATLKRVYTWKDDQGVTQFSDHEEDAAGATVLELGGIINTLPALLSPATETINPPPGVKSKTAVLLVQLQDAVETMEQARQLQQILDARKAGIDRLTMPDNQAGVVGLNTW